MSLIESKARIRFCFTLLFHDDFNARDYQHLFLRDYLVVFFLIMTFTYVHVREKVEVLVFCIRNIFPRGSSIDQFLSSLVYSIYIAAQRLICRNLELTCLKIAAL